jgi:hypothetical protein
MAVEIITTIAIITMKKVDRADQVEEWPPFLLTVQPQLD